MPQRVSSSGHHRRLLHPWQLLRTTLSLAGLQVYSALDVPGSNPVVLAGDSHNAWDHELRNKKGQRCVLESVQVSDAPPGHLGPVAGEACQARPLANGAVIRSPL
jgi:hypothetical protein